MPFPRPADPEPMSSINITPMIDVMLVLIVMLILTIPLKTHEVPIELPTGGVASESTTHRLEIAATGALTWDGRGIGDGELPRLLEAVSADTGAVLHLRTDPAVRYERFDTVLATVKRANVTRLGFVGDAALRDWDRPI